MVPALGRAPAISMIVPHRKPQVCVLGSAEPGSGTYELAGQAGEELARLGITVVSGCGSPATRVAAERAI
jgi:predicted Rossmann-fold nucleotide-binding protein